MKKKSKILITYKNLLNHVQINTEHNIEDKQVYNNFVSLLIKEYQYQKNFDIDILENAINFNIRKNKNNKDIDYKSELNNLKDSIISNFDKQSSMHYIFCPLQGSSLNEDIRISNILFLKLENDNEKFINKIANELNVPIQDLKFFLEHTINSRSKDFLNSNMLIIKVEACNKYVRRYASEIIQDVFDFIRLIHTAYEEINYLLKYKAIPGDENSHVAIFSNKNWECCHSHNWNAFLNLKIDLNFLKNPINQNLLLKFISKYTLNKNETLPETLRILYNAIKKFNRGMKYERQDVEVCNLLLLTACESIITQKHNEKRLRLCVLIPKIIGNPKQNSTNSSLIIDNLYRSRNNFVHSGKKMHHSFEENDLEVAQRMYALVLIKLFEYILNERIQSMENLNKNLNDLFEQSIFS
ncbi:hypothetical protein K2V64_06750 [Mammaliicoccus sciuri]|uniref:hypothetical protein n=1 Tax=Mammaliicoccus sciuri TaxID=1296 RepID=UPI001E4C959D|nr:hypothetical protein [Mammaliicoccus sciuri]